MIFFNSCANNDKVWHEELRHWPKTHFQRQSIHLRFWPKNHARVISRACVSAIFNFQIAIFFDFSTNFEFWFQSLVPGVRIAPTVRFGVLCWFSVWNTIRSCLFFTNLRSDLLTAGQWLRAIRNYIFFWGEGTFNTSSTKTSILYLFSKHKLKS